jgi:hypothetical protein
MVYPIHISHRRGHSLVSRPPSWKTVLAYACTKTCSKCIHILRAIGSIFLLIRRVVEHDMHFLDLLSFILAQSWYKIARIRQPAVKPSLCAQRSALQAYVTPFRPQFRLCMCCDVTYCKWAHVRTYCTVRVFRCASDAMVCRNCSAVKCNSVMSTVLNYTTMWLLNSTIRWLNTFYNAPHAKRALGVIYFR